MAAVNSASLGRQTGSSAFAARLHQASDGANVPPMNHGRLTWMVRQVGVSMEAARKWYAGETTPRRDMLRRIAAALNVEEAWLSLGVGNQFEHPSDGQSYPGSMHQVTIDADLKTVVDSAVRGKPTLISRDGEAQAVVVSFNEWQRLTRPPSLGRLLMSAPFSGDDLPSRSAMPLRAIDV